MSDYNCEQCGCNAPYRFDNENKSCCTDSRCQLSEQKSKRIKQLETQLAESKEKHTPITPKGATWEAGELENKCIQLSNELSDLKNQNRFRSDPYKKRILELEASQQWQPISTAPKDGTDILGVWWQGEVCMCHYITGAWWYVDKTCGWKMANVPPDKWYPIQTAPERGETNQGDRQ